MALRPGIPAEQIADANKLEADGRVFLYEMEMAGSGAIIRVRSGPKITWNSMLFEELGISVSGKGQSAGEEVFRPKMQIVNPEGIFSAYIASGELERAIVREWTVLRTHLDTNQPIYSLRIWSVGKILTLNKNMITIELREIGDGPNFILPGRIFMPPEFPQVSLG